MKGISRMDGIDRDYRVKPLGGAVHGTADCYRLYAARYSLVVCFVYQAVGVPGASPGFPVIRNFDHSLALELEPTTSASASVGDLNGDGKLDIVLAKGRHWPEPNRVLLGDGRGDFSGILLHGSADRTYSGALADLNGDGSLDLVVSNDRPDQKRIHINDGSGTFHEAGTFGDPDWPTRYVTLADLNGDGFADIVASNRNGSRSTKYTPSFICFNDGQGRFPDCRPLATKSSTITVAADFDGDGAIDLFTPNRDNLRMVPPTFLLTPAGGFATFPPLV